MKLLIKKILFVYKYGNLYLRIKIFFCSQYQKKIIQPLKFFFKENFAKLDYSSGFKKLCEKKNYQFLSSIFKKLQKTKWNMGRKYANKIVGFR
jgi:hypothetical protein